MPPLFSPSAAKASGPRPSANPTTLQGTIERVAFSAEDTGYTVARLHVQGRPERVTIVGTLPTLTAGETWRVTGRWVRHPTYGEQFQVDHGEPILPKTPEGIERALGSGLLKGIGPALAQRLVARFGADTLRILDEEPARLAEVPGIGPLRQARITTAWAEQREIREVLLFLRGHGVSPGYAAKIVKTYGQAAIATVRENPYRLAQEIVGIGFRIADTIAQRLGIAVDSPLRAQAGLVHLLREGAHAGHVYLPEGALCPAAATTLGIPAVLHEKALADLHSNGLAILDETPDGPAVYLPPLHTAEVRLAHRLATLLRTPQVSPRLDLPAGLAAAERERGLLLSPEQRQAVQLALTHPLLVITGGPGTGKTTLLHTLIRLLEAQGRRVALASPTGRAAKRLAELTQRPAATLHRLLEYSPHAQGFQRTAAHPLASDVLIVDELSMVDLPLADHLLQALPLTATLVLVGDADQLPSVGPGTVLADLLALEGLPALRLTTLFRQAAASRIVTNAHRIQRGELPDLSAPRPGETPDFLFLPEADPERLQRRIVDLMARELPARYGLDPGQDIQVLTPMHRGPLGTTALNAALQGALNPARARVPEIARGAHTFRIGDRVLQLRNNYDRGTMNGELGRVVSIDLTEEELLVQIEDQVVAYDRSELDELSLAYAITIHKSQGSEYPAVLVIAHPSHYLLLERNLLYTALTRAKRLLVLVGTAQAIAMATKRETTTRRYSALPTRVAALQASPTETPAAARE